jgi:hypothetical protein
MGETAEEKEGLNNHRAGGDRGVRIGGTRQGDARLRENAYECGVGVAYPRGGHGGRSA